MTVTRSNLLSAFAFLLATSCCWLPPLIALLGGAAGLAAFSGWFEPASPYLMTAGIALFSLSLFRIWKKRRSDIRLVSVVTCPVCGFSKKETMPTDACQFFYECENCHQLLRPKPGDCCVFCSFGTVKCPPIQAGKECC